MTTVVYLWIPLMLPRLPWRWTLTAANPDPDNNPNTPNYESRYDVQLQGRDRRDRHSESGKPLEFAVLSLASISKSLAIRN